MGKHPVWVSIGGARNGLKLGYRKGARSGVWVAKTVDHGTRREGRLGTADDDGSGADARSYTAAVAAAIQWASEKAGTKPSLIVRGAVESYIRARIARNSKGGADARSRLRRHVLSDSHLAEVPLADLSAKMLKDWRGRLDPRLAPATVNRLLNDFRAALRSALDTHWRELPGTLPTEIEQGLRGHAQASTARIALLPDPDVRRVVEAAFNADPDLGALVLILACTGARFSQAAQITVADVQITSHRIMVRASRKGKGVKGRQRIAVPVGSDVIGRLEPILNGREGHELLLERWVHRQVAPTEWTRIRRAPWSNASEMLRGWARTLAAAGIAYVQPYALRHSSIVRMLTVSVPVRIVAALHDTSSAMIERHYSAHILDMADELARKAIVSMTSPSPLAAASD